MEDRELRAFLPDELHEFIKTYDGEEMEVNETLHFGVSAYAYMEDLERCKDDYPGFRFKVHKYNSLFGEMTDKNLKIFIKWLYESDGHLIA